MAGAAAQHEHDRSRRLEEQALKEAAEGGSGLPALLPLLHRRRCRCCSRSSADGRLVRASLGPPPPATHIRAGLPLRHSHTSAPCPPARLPACPPDAAPSAEAAASGRHHTDPAAFLQAATKDVYGTTKGGSLADTVGRRAFFNEKAR